MHEPAQLGHRAQVAALLLGIRAKQRFCNDLFSLAACLIQGEDFGWSDLVLPLAATLVCVALIVGFAARLPERTWFWMLFRPGDKHHRLDGGLLVVIRHHRQIGALWVADPI